MIIDVNATAVIAFILGFVTCAAIVVILAIFYVVFPHITEAKRFFTFWLKVRSKANEEKKELAKHAK